MEYVSLLPPEIKEKKVEEKKQRILFRVAFFIFLAALVAYAFLFAGTFLARSDLSVLRAEKATVERQIESLAQYEDLYQEMNAAEGRLNAAMGNNPLWHDFLQDLAILLPPGAWLSDLTLSYGGESGTLNLRGWSFSNGILSDMLENAKEFDSLADVRIRNTTDTLVDGRPALQYVIDAQVNSGPEYIETGNGPAAEENLDETEDVETGEGS